MKLSVREYLIKVNVTVHTSVIRMSRVRSAKASKRRWHWFERMHRIVIG